MVNVWIAFLIVAVAGSIGGILHGQFFVDDNLPLTAKKVQQTIVEKVSKV
jgi:hypothetical protein